MTTKGDDDMTYHWLIGAVIAIIVLQVIPTPHWLWRWRIAKITECRFQVQAIGILKPWWHPVILNWDREVEFPTREKAQEFLDRMLARNN